MLKFISPFHYIDYITGRLNINDLRLHGDPNPIIINSDWGSYASWWARFAMSEILTIKNMRHLQLQPIEYKSLYSKVIQDVKNNNRRGWWKWTSGCLSRKQSSQIQPIFTFPALKRCPCISERPQIIYTYMVPNIPYMNHSASTTSAIVPDSTKCVLVFFPGLPKKQWIPLICIAIV